MTDSTWWLLLAGACIAIELVTGTFYLLMISLGMAAAALAAYLGLPVPTQLVVAACVGGGAVSLWRVKTARRSSEPQAQANPNVLLDIGESVHVSRWKPDRTADVQYRGAHWTAVAHPDLELVAGNFRVIEVVGNRLVLNHS